MAIRDSKNKRLFIVGCSYSKYAYPTYADILGVDFDETINAAASGAGNTYIFNTAIHLLSKYEFTENDTVIVQWSGITRWDTIRGHDTYFQTPGTLEHQDVIPLEVVDKHFNLVSEAYKLINYVRSVKDVSRHLKCKFATFNMLDPWISLFYGEPYSTSFFNKDMDYINEYYPIEKLKETFNKVEALTSVEEFVWGVPLNRPQYFYEGPGKRQDETHPSTTQHLAFAKYIDKELNLNGTNLYTEQVSEYVKKIEDVFCDPALDFDKLAKKEKLEYHLFDYNSTENPNVHLSVNPKKYPASLFNKKHYEYNNNMKTWKQ